MNYAQPPHPYGAPQQQVPFRTSANVAAMDPTGHRPKVRVWFLIAAVASGFLYFSGLVGIVAAFVVNDHDVSPFLALGGWGVAMIGALLFYVKLGLGMYWLHGAWKWLPVDQRVDKNGKRMGPDGVFMLLIPYYHFYWMFPINMGLCDAMERMRYAAGSGAPPTPTVAPRDTAMWACILEIIPFANFFVAPFYWASYMRRIDAMHDEIMDAVPVRG